MSETTLVHATAVAWHGRGVLLCGASGSGKSSLALALMQQGWMLVGDDYVAVTRQEESLAVRPAEALRGWLEVRGQGLLAVPYLHLAQVALILELMTDPPRLPETVQREMMGVSLPHVQLQAHGNGLVAGVAQALISA
jgi:HPr kinase/phosphorylase